MKKTIEEYMSLPYTIEITPDEGSFFVKVKELEGCMSVGDTKAEALEMIDDAMLGWLTVALEDRLEIPLPESMQKERYSGKFPLRLPLSLHKKLAENAIKERTSLNQYLVMLLSEANTISHIKKLFEGQEKEICKEPEYEPTIVFTGNNVIPFRNRLKVVGE